MSRMVFQNPARTVVVQNPRRPGDTQVLIYYTLDGGATHRVFGFEAKRAYVSDRAATPHEQHDLNPIGEGPKP